MIALLIVSVTSLIPLVALVYQLGGFHSMLSKFLCLFISINNIFLNSNFGNKIIVYKNLTTYDFIVSEQKKQREKKQAKLAAKREKKQKKQNATQSIGKLFLFILFCFNFIFIIILFSLFILF